MMKHIIKRILIGVGVLLSVASARGQFLDSTTGLLQMPTAEMNRAGTFMATVNYLNQHTTSEMWDYNTYGYGLNVTIWERLEMAYVCTLMHGTTYYETQPDVPVNWVNQDRHFSAKLLLLREGDFGLNWIPALAIGVSDPTTAFKKDGYRIGVTDKGNGFFNRYYFVATKHFHTDGGELGAHLGYQFNHRTDIPINGPCVGLDWKPVWFQSRWLMLDLIAEYDSRTFNIGFIASLLDDHFEVMFDLQAMKWVSIGLRFKLHLKD